MNMTNLSGAAAQHNVEQEKEKQNRPYESKQQMKLFLKKLYKPPTLE